LARIRSATPAGTSTRDPSLPGATVEPPARQAPTRQAVARSEVSRASLRRVRSGERSSQTAGAPSTSDFQDEG
jgi:hypothetical protein